MSEHPHFDLEYLSWISIFEVEMSEWECLFTLLVNRMMIYCQQCYQSWLKSLFLQQSKSMIYRVGDFLTRSIYESHTYIIFNSKKLNDVLMIYFQQDFKLTFLYSIWPLKTFVVENFHRYLFPRFLTEKKIISNQVFSLQWFRRMSYIFVNKTEVILRYNNS